LASPFVALYGIVLVVRHTLYNWGILRSYAFDFPVICVGNLAVGGTGKTPHTLLIANILLKENITFAILSRGYKRRSRGFLYVKTDSSAAHVGDEPLMIKRRLPNAVVAVCKNRIQAIRRIKQDFPDVQAIILDDAFQYRKLNAGMNLLLTPYNRLMTQDALLPLGRLRDLRSRRYHADIVLATQCPPTMLPFDFNVLKKNLKLMPYQQFYSTIYRYSSPVCLTSGEKAALTRDAVVIALAGIANPQAFVHYLHSNYKVVQVLIFSDHHYFGMTDMLKIRRALRNNPNACLVATEKDAMRLLHCGLQDAELQRIVYQPIEVEFLRGEDSFNFQQNILNYVKSNKRISVFC
jgi:tetraacyldisaccharide 4'-kinase